METIAVITTIIVALITAVVGPIIVSWVKIKMEKNNVSNDIH
jgi:putative effector of murein hydrolase